MSEKKVKLSIKSKEKPTPIIPQLRIALNMSEGCVRIVGYGGDGTMWYIANITTDGKFNRCGSLPNDIGLQVNRNGQILEAK